MSAAEPRRRPVPGAGTGLRCDGVRFGHAPGAVPLLRGLTFSLRPGELVALLGPNGSGKSTLCLLLAGVMAPQVGSVTLDGRPVAACHATDIQLVQQSLDDQVVAPTVQEDAAFGPESLGLDAREVGRRVESALARVGLPGYGDRTVETLSGGELARLAVAGALAAGPRYLILDEPTAHLDPPTADRLLSVLRRLAGSGLGVLLVTHRPEEGRHADRVAVLRDGAIVREGPPAEVLYDAALLAGCGLRMPPAADLVRQLRSRGVMVPGAPLSPEELAEALCRCYA